MILVRLLLLIPLLCHLFMIPPYQPTPTILITGSHTLLVNRRIFAVVTRLRTALLPEHHTTATFLVSELGKQGRLLLLAQYLTTRTFSTQIP